METTRRQLLTATLAAAALPSTLAACAGLGGPRVRGRRGESHEDYMRIALELARTDLLHFGAVLVDRGTGRVVGEGRNRSYENPTRHAEIAAIDDFLAQLGCLGDLEEALCGFRNTALYTTAEPCPMCMGAIVWARIPEVYYGASIPFLVANGQCQVDVRAALVANASSFERPGVHGGVLEMECNALYRNGRCEMLHCPAP